MTEIEQKALALLKECGWGGAHLKRAWNPRYEALCRAIEQHEAFKREVSDAIIDCGAERYLSRFILPKPVDPLVDAIQEADEVETGWARASDYAEHLRAALAKRGLEVREIEK